MTLTKALLLSIFIGILITENYGYGYWMISRPIFAGPLVGLIMGDFQTGLFVGATVELMYMGILPIGGSVPPNAQIAGTLSTVFAIVSGDANVGIALALPIGTLAQLLIMLAWNINIVLAHRADKYIADGNIKAVERTHLLGIPIFFFVFFISSFLAVYFGSDFVTMLVDKMPAVISKGLSMAAKMLPAVGLAMLLKMMDFKKFWCFFIGGFVLAVYLSLGTVAVSLIAVVIAVAIYMLGKDKQDDVDGFGEDEPAEVGENEGILTRKELRKTFIRSFFSMTSINYERYCSLGFCYAMIPALKKLYPNPDDMKEAMSRHNEFYNCHPYAGNAVLGVTLALEEQRAMGKPITGDAISATKSAMMGPLSGIGDSIFKATFMTIFAALAAALALDGNVLAPIIFIVPNVALNLLSRWYFIKYGHKMGASLVTKMQGSGLMEKFVQGATIVGMMVVGAMVVNFVSIPIAVTWTFGEKQIVLLDLINAIVPSILPLLMVFGFYKIMSKHKKGMYICLLSCFVLGILGVAIGLF